MNAENNKISELLVDQLASFEDRLDGQPEQGDIVAGIKDAISLLLDEDYESETQIRQVLQERHVSGQLSKKHFELIRSILDRCVTEQLITSPFDTTTATIEFEKTLVLDYEDHAIPPDRTPARAAIVTPVEPKITEHPQASRTVQVGSVLRDRFMLQERVSGGGMGVVYKALDRRLAEGGDPAPWVAIKVLSAEFADNGIALQALRQEAVKGRSLTHPNIVRFIDFDRDDDLYFIVMEWLEGRTLAEILDSPDTRSIDQARAFAIVRQVGQALDYAHRSGIVHADIKPGNIMVLPNGDAKLFDFGVARVRQKTLLDQPDFDPGVLGLLTPAYSSMQVLTGEDPMPVDDVFSLACLLYRLIAGFRVFGPRNAAEAAEEGLVPQELKGVSSAQWRAIKKALSYSRVTRYETMAEFLLALDIDNTKSIAISAPKRVTPEPVSDSSGIARWLIFVAILAGALGAAQWRFGLWEMVQERFLQGAPVAVESIMPQPTVVETLQETIEEIVVATIQDERVVETVIEPPEAADNTDAPGADAGIEYAQAPDITEEQGEVANIDFPDAPDMLAIERPTELVEALVDFSTLPPADAELGLAFNGTAVRTANVTLREDDGPILIDLLRTDVELPLTLRLEEVGFSGNRSPWSTGQFSFSDNGFIEFPVGQDRARVTLTMLSDSLREPDQASTLRVREADSAASELALINVTLEDDDQRTFEAQLPPNTVGFAFSQVSVRERDPAVLIDIVRFNPDDTTMIVAYVLRDITATEGEDYFAPAEDTIEFGPGQRSARLLIPLVQDSAFEDNEAFSVELSTGNTLDSAGVFSRTAVMIRDDDS
jgi:hypothetical protein